MKIEGINLADVPVMSSANADDLALIVQQNGLRLQSYQNLTSTYYPISGSLKVPGVTLPLVQIATARPTDELVLIVENNGLAVKQIGFAAPTMAVGSSIEVEGIALPSVRFSGTIDGDEYVIAVRENKSCLIPIPNYFSAGALPTTGRTMLANLTSSLILDEGTGGPTWSRATKAWGFNELGYLTEIASGCAFLGGARLVRNLVAASEDVSTAAWTKSNCTAPTANSVVCANTTSLQRFYAAAYTAVAGQVIFHRARFSYVDIQFVQIRSSGYHSNGCANFDLINGTSKTIGAASASGVIQISPGVYDCWVKINIQTSAAASLVLISFVSSLDSLFDATFVGDGIKSVGVTRLFSCDVTNYDASYVPEYVSVGVNSDPFPAGIDGAKYFETDWQGAPIPSANLLGFRREAAATNNVLHSRDLSNAAWSTKTNITPDKTATGLDGIANTATTLTASAADAIILQSITLASADRCASAYVKRRTGTGTISFTQDGGSTWTDITSQIDSSTWSRVQITATLANPSVGFKISTSGDAIDVDCVQNEAGSVATSPIVTTTAAVTRNADSLTYQTASNWSDTEGTAYIEVQPLAWVNGGAIGSATNGLLLSAANSGATASDGTNTSNGPAPSGRKKLAMRWGAGAMTVASCGVVGTPGIYDGGMGLTSVGIAINSRTYCGPVALYNYAMTDAELKAITT